MIAGLPKLPSDWSARFIFARVNAEPVNGQGSTDNAHAAASAQLFHAANEIPVRHHIIAFGFHHHHEIALPFDIEQYFGITRTVVEKRVQRADGSFGSTFQRDPDAQGSRQRNFVFFKRDDFIDRELRVRTVLYSHTAADQYGDFEFRFLA